jgi:hypothetical protein
MACGEGRGRLLSPGRWLWPRPRIGRGRGLRLGLRLCMGEARVEVGEYSVRAARGAGIGEHFLGSAANWLQSLPAKRDWLFFTHARTWHKDARNSA